MKSLYIRRVFKLHCTPHMWLADFTLSILPHLTERDRTRLLLTCKSMDVWRQRRRDAAKLAFENVKAVGKVEDNNKVFFRIRTFLQRGTIVRSCTVVLQDNDLVRIDSQARFVHWTNAHNSDLPLEKLFFAPWSRALIEGDSERQVEKTTDDEILGALIVKGSFF